MKTTLLKIESGFSKAGLGFIVSLLLILAVSAVSHVNFKTAHHGNEYTMLSEQPFNLEHSNDLQLRILSPLVAYLLFMRGVLFKYFMLFILCIFFATLYTYLRKKNFSITQSVVMTAVLAFSTLTFYQLYFPAYTDPGSFLLILLLLMFYERKMWATVLLSLLLFNHESNIFLFPFLFLLINGKQFSTRHTGRILLQFAIAIIPYYLYREFILNRVQIGYTLQYYIDPGNMQWTREHVLPNLANGIFQAFRLAWIIPVIAIVINIKEKRYFEIALLLSAIIFVAMQFLVAYDISRLMGLSFPVILIGAYRLKESFNEKVFLSLIIGIFLLDLLLPAYCVGALEPIPYGPGWLY